MTICMPHADFTVIPAGRGKMVSYGDSSLGVSLWPTDPVGTHVLTLTSIVVGSRISIRDQAGTTTLYDQIAAAATVVIPMAVYSSGSGLNAWRIKIRKASATPFYQPYETLLTGYVGASSIYVNQLPDQR